MVERPPKGYSQMQHPLPHNFNYRFSLNAENVNVASTMVTLLRTSEVATGVSEIEVNPKNGAFAEDNGPLIHQDSIVPRMSISFTAALSKGAIETDAVRSLKLMWMPIYISFLNSLEAEDSKTAVQIEDILELTHNTDNKDVHPTFNGNNLIGFGGNQAVSTVAATEVFGDYGLSVNTVLEALTFDRELFFDALQYYTNSSMLKKVTGRMKTIILKRDYPYRYYSNRFTYPSVKRGNPYTFCGILFHLPQVGTADQIPLAGDTTDIPHVNVAMHVRYNEWNPEFDQSAL